MGYYNPFYHLRCWCQKVLPTVYDDSLSYYEFLGKICKKVNDLGDIVNNIINTGSWNAIVAYTRPEFFGAVGDGVADDDKAVQDAIDDANKNHKIVLLSGRYLIGKTLNVPNGVVIIGQYGGELISKQMQENGFVPTTILSVGSENAFINVVFNGNAPAGNSQAIGDRENNNPLVSCIGVSRVLFYGCSFKNYDSNYSDQIPSYNYACLSCRESDNLTIEKCEFNRDKRECTVFYNCHDVVIDSCIFNNGNEVGGNYSDIGMLNGYNFQVLNTHIYHGDNLTTSPINAMADNIVIDNCWIYAKNSNYGIDYGSEIENNGFDELTISNCFIQTSIAASGNASNIKHNHIRIYNNVIDGNDVTTASGQVMLYAFNGERIKVVNNEFRGGNGNNYAIRTEYTDGDIEIVNNIFDGNGIRTGSNTVGLVVNNNVFNGFGFFIGEAPDAIVDFPILNCRFNDDIGKCANAVTYYNIIFIGCYLANTNLYWAVSTVPTPLFTHYDASLSYVAEVGKGTVLPNDDT